MLKQGDWFFSYFHNFPHREDRPDEERSEKTSVFLLYDPGFPFKDTSISFDLHIKGVLYCITDAYR